MLGLSVNLFIDDSKSRRNCSMFIQKSTLVGRIQLELPDGNPMLAVVHVQLFLVDLKWVLIGIYGLAWREVRQSVNAVTRPAFNQLITSSSAGCVCAKYRSRMVQWREVVAWWGMWGHNVRLLLVSVSTHAWLYRLLNTQFAASRGFVKISDSRHHQPLVVCSWFYRLFREYSSRKSNYAVLIYLIKIMLC